MHAHFKLTLFGKSHLSIYLGVHLVTEIGNTSVNISWTVVVERNTHFTALLVCLVSHSASVPHAPLQSGLAAAKNSIFYSSWVSQQDRPHRNSIQAIVSTRVAHQVLLVYPLSPCVAISLTVVNSFSINGQKMSLNWEKTLGQSGPDWRRLAAML